MATLGAIVGLLGLSAYADTTWTGATDSEFGTASNWDNGSPGNPETVAIIGSGATVSNTVNHTGTNAYQLTVAGGSTLSSSADFTTTRLTISDGSTLNLTGGSLIVPVQSPNNNVEKIFINDGSLLNISGGVHTFNERIATHGTISTIRINGSEATVNVHQQSTFTATTEFIFDADGISTLDSDSRLGFGGDDLTVDATDYTGPSRTFVLVDVDWLEHSSGFGGTIDITPPAGYSYSYNQDDIQSTGEITLEILERGTIFHDDFVTNGLVDSAVKRNSTWAGSDNWRWTSGTLENTNTTRGVGICFPVPAELTIEDRLEVDLVYSVTNGSTGLSMHLWGLKDVSSSSSTEIMNPWGPAGMWPNSTSIIHPYNLKDGSDDYSQAGNIGASGRAAVQVPSATGTGLSHNAEVKIAGLGAGLSRVSDYDYIAIGFQKHSAAPDLAIDYVCLKALEPNGTLLLIR